MRQTKEVRSDQCWAWLQNGHLKRETESLIMASQNQSIRKNLVKAKIDKSLGKIVHWKLARQCNFEARDKWYEHEPGNASENKDYKILWDFSIQTDHVIEARIPDLVLVDKRERSCEMIDFAVPGDSRIEEKEEDKTEKYQDLGRELQKIWNVKVKIIPLVVSPLGAMPKQFRNRLKQIGITARAAQVQKAAVLGSARILRKVLES